MEHSVQADQYSLGLYIVLLVLVSGRDGYDAAGHALNQSYSARSRKGKVELHGCEDNK